MKKIGTIFLRGLIAILPIALTIYLIYWLATTAESVLGKAIRLVIKEHYVPGMGVLVGFLITVGIGILLKIWVFRKLFSLAETVLQRLPGVKSIYGSVHDLVGFFDASKQKDFDKTVMVSFIDDDTQLMGLVTREDFSDLPEGIGNEETVAVYLPMSYQLGGFTVMVPRNRIRPVEMKVDEAMKFVLTAGVAAKNKDVTAP